MAALPLRIGLVLTCLPVPALAGVHIVDSTGRGDQLTIAAAVAAASDGDLVLVRSGTYAGFVVDDKSLAITIDVGALVTIEGTIEIDNLAANKTLVLAELDVHGPVNASGSGPALTLSNDAGRVRIERCELDGGRGLGGSGNPWNPGAVGVELQGCSDATFVQCTIRGGDGEGTAPGMGFFDFGGAGGDGVHASSSNAAVYDCLLQGGAGGGGEGQGGDGGRGYDHDQGPGGGSFRRCTLEGGDGGYAHGFGIGGYGGDALFASHGATHSLLDWATFPGDPGASTGFAYPPGGQDLAGPGTYQLLPGRARTFSADFLGASGGQVTVEVHGLQGDRVYVLPGDPGWLSIPGQSTAVLKPRPLPTAARSFALISHTGTASFVLPLPSLPASQVNRTLAFQGYVLDANGVLLPGDVYYVEVMRCASLLPDCNGNGAFDSCDLLDGSAQDLGHDGIPDSCDPDCNGNGLPDDLDILSGFSTDANGNGVPDACEGQHIIHVDASAAPFGDGSAATPFQTIGEGIAAAVTGDIVRIEDGTYTGAGNRELGLGGRSIVIESANGPAACVIDCQSQGRAFAVHEGESAPMAFRGLTFRNGHVLLQSWNQVRGGGAIVVDHASARIENCVFESCTAAGGGGGVTGFVAGLTIVNCTFRNDGQASGGAAGGGLLAGGGTTSLSRSVFDQNTGQVGGALLTYGGITLTISDCSFRGNTASIYGGGLVLQSGGVIDDCLVIDNSAPSGGGITAGADTWILDSTIAQNSATQTAGGLYAAFADPGGHLRVRNSIIWGNSAPTGAQIGTVSFQSTLQLRSCDLQGGAAGIPPLGSGILDYDSSNIVLDPLFVSPNGPDGNPATWADNDLHLGSFSPCIDAGNNALVPNDQLDLDQDGDTLERIPIDVGGAPRIVDIPTVIDTGLGIGPFIDIGAYERQP
jgi:hypothetical protein